MDGAPFGRALFISLSKESRPLRVNQLRAGLGTGGFPIMETISWILCLYLLTIIIISSVFHADDVWSVSTTCLNIYDFVDLEK